MRPRVELEPEEEPFVKPVVQLKPEIEFSSASPPSITMFNVPSSTLPGWGTSSQVLNTPSQMTTLPTPLPHELPPAPHGAALLCRLHLCDYTPDQSNRAASHHTTVHKINSTIRTVITTSRNSLINFNGVSHICCLKNIINMHIVNRMTARSTICACTSSRS